MSTKFLPSAGNYRNVIAFQKAEAIYDLTYDFTKKFLDKRDRTVDQMVQAARSGKQNIAEGIAAGATSKETLLKLINVAKASLKELLEDYNDYLRTRRLIKWSYDSVIYRRTKSYCHSHNLTKDYLSLRDHGTDEELANLAIILLEQTDYLLYHLFERYKQNFLAQGGMKESMYQARKQWRSQHPGGPHCPVNPEQEPCKSCALNSANSSSSNPS